MTANDHSRRGITLIELLVVVSILLLLLVVAAPALTPSLEARRLREAARMVNVYFGSARNAAMQTGRPAGVMLLRSTGTPQACTTLVQAEVPPPYTGDTIFSRIVLSSSGSMNVSVSYPMGDAPGALIQAGDVLRLNYQGRYWRIVSGPPGNSWTLAPLDNLPPTNVPPTAPAPGVAFQIFRQPVRTAAAPLELPAGVVLDIASSGHRVAFASYLNDTRPVTILFSPNGSLGWTYIAGTNAPVTQAMYLMIGRRDRLPVTSTSGSWTTVAEDSMPNWRDPANYWVTINAQTGSIGTVPVAPDATTLDLSRRLATDAFTLGGR